MSQMNQQAKAIFLEAIELESAEELTSFLQLKCRDNIELRDRVEELLRAHDRARSFLGGSFASEETVDRSRTMEEPGATIGPYKLMEQIGEGGMGSVFVAYQQHPIRRKVALKLIKPGMDTKAVIARFEAERQALALMDHPNIAKVVDAGTTDSGRPFFAMELVKGVPITEYCDKNRLSIDERLELFIDVCKAIQHAHQKGIIHRDVKPSNVLVTLHDGKPVAKVIDFGVAKAVNARLTDKTVYTEHLQVVGTLLYMSPEQAELSGLEIDTRSDIYSLGVLLYELLTGTTPFRKEELVHAGFDEQRRLIREVEPPRASIRISSLGETATAVADARKTVVKRLQEVIRGELDWVILKSIDKDRARRYETAADFSRDVQRYLSNEAVYAHPPSVLYGARKFALKHRIALATLTLVFISLSVGLGIAEWQRRLAVAAQEEKADAIRKLEDRAIDLAKLAAGFGDTDAMNAALDVVRKNESRRHNVLQIEGLLLFTQGHLESAREKFDLALDLKPDDYFSQAFLTKTAINAGESAQFAAGLAKLDGMTPSDEYDRIAQASVEVFRDPFRALQLLDEIEGGTGGTGKLVVRGDANIHAAFSSGSLDYCDKGLEDLDRADLVFGPTSNSRCFRLLTLTFAMYVAESKGEDERAAAYGKRATVANEELIKAGYEDSLARSVQWHYYQYGPNRNPNLAWQAVKRVKLDSDYVINIAIERMLNEKDPKKALSDFDNLVGKEKSTPYIQYARALLLACLSDRNREIASIAEGLAQQDSAVFKRFAMFLYALLGDQPKAEEVAAKAVKIDPSRFMAGELNSFKAFESDEFRSFAKLGDRDRLTYTMSELTRGLMAIMHGKGKKGHEAFVDAQKSQLKIYYLHMYASAFADQMLKNSQWPCGRSLAREVMADSGAAAKHE